MDAYLGRKDSPVDTEISNARRIRDLAAASPAEIAVRHVAADGTEAALTWAELDRRSSQLAGALAGRGLALGDRLGIGLRNSPQFVLAVLAAWKIGAVPVPVRWDVPEWELTRLREVINPRVHLGDADLAWIDATAALAVPDLPDAVSPQINGICSSGSTGTPKIILTDRPSVYDERLTTPFIAAWNPVSRPQTIGVLAPMYHANGLTTLYSLLAGDSLVVLEKFDAARVVDVVERHRVSTFTATPTMLQRIADLPGIEERDLSSLAWIL
ncbi:class I adenylate-forming enzyme family protein, partial [Frankia sp. EI5c]|uniref:class I adenylate-forming enzyme family protein n=1 Tax=Frankia sp. EI5c TaxID=683316 RepID=UPI0037BF525E